MAIKINWQDLLKRFINWEEIVRVYKNGGQIRPETVPPVFSNYLCFTAVESNSTFALVRNWSAPIVYLETSYDKQTRSDYTVGTIIILANVGDKVYMRSKSETPTGFSSSQADCYTFSMTWKIWASWDVCSLLCKNGADTITNYAFINLFNGCTALTSAPSISATYFYPLCCAGMFFWCSSLATLPKIHATTLDNWCCNVMFGSCSSIKISATQTWEYQTPYRIPTEWTWTPWVEPLWHMFSGTWGTFTGTPSINTTYYTSNQVI